MKKLVVYTFAALISLSSISKAEVTLIPTENPAKTICIKNGKAADANTFFSSTTNLSFEIFKPGTKAEFDAIVNKLKATDGVENCIAGKVTGDFYAITLTLKSEKDKAWFAKTFKDAGLNHIKINNKEVVEVDKL